MSEPVKPLGEMVITKALRQDVACLEGAVSNIAFVADGYARVREPKLLTASMLQAADALEALHGALKEIYENNMEYLRINNLAGAESNHDLCRARAALAFVEKEPKP